MAISVPVDVNSQQRQFVKDIMKTALHTDSASIINETTAVALAYADENMAPGDREEDVLIFSFGGGFLGIALVDISQNSIGVKEAYGENIGIVDFTKAIFCGPMEKNVRSHAVANLKAALQLCERNQWHELSW